MLFPDHKANRKYFFFSLELCFQNASVFTITQFFLDDQEDFFKNYCQTAVKNNHKIYFQATWVDAISNKVQVLFTSFYDLPHLNLNLKFHQNEFACMAFISFIRVKANVQSKDYSATYDFTRQVIDIIQKHVNMTVRYKFINRALLFKV